MPGAGREGEFEEKHPPGAVGFPSSLVERVFSTRLVLVLGQA
jgi:hypothetical protein